MFLSGSPFQQFAEVPRVGSKSSSNPSRGGGGGTISESKSSSSVTPTSSNKLIEQIQTLKDLGLSKSKIAEIICKANKVSLVPQ